MKLYHCTTPGKAAKYHQSGFIRSPVRGFNTFEAAITWAWKTNRSVIYELECNTAYKLPDHHNEYGEAYWTDESIPVENLKCVASPNRSPIRELIKR